MSVIFVDRKRPIFLMEEDFTVSDDGMRYITFGKGSICYKLTSYSHQDMSQYWSEKRRCEFGSHAWLAFDINVVIDYWDKESFSIYIFKMTRDINLIHIYDPRNYNIAKQKILNHEGNIDVQSPILDITNDKSDHKYWTMSKKQKLVYLLRVIFGLRMNVEEQINFAKEIVKIDKEKLSGTRVGSQTGSSMYDVMKGFIKIYDRLTEKQKKKTRQRFSTTEMDIVVLYSLCKVFKDQDGWYIYDKETIFYPDETIEEIALLDPGNNLSSFKELKMEYV